MVSKSEVLVLNVPVDYDVDAVLFSQNLGEVDHGLFVSFRVIHHAIASAHAICPSKPSVFAMSR